MYDLLYPVNQSMYLTYLHVLSLEMFSSQMFMRFLVSFKLMNHVHWDVQTIRDRGLSESGAILGTNRFSKLVFLKRSCGRQIE